VVLFILFYFFLTEGNESIWLPIRIEDTRLKQIYRQNILRQVILSFKSIFEFLLKLKYLIKYVLCVKIRHI
jgi:hypothetical protein